MQFLFVLLLSVLLAPRVFIHTASPVFFSNPSIRMIFPGDRELEENSVSKTGSVSTGSTPTPTPPVTDTSGELFCFSSCDIRNLTLRPLGNTDVPFFLFVQGRGYGRVLQHGRPDAFQGGDLSSGWLLGIAVVIDECCTCLAFAVRTRRCFLILYSELVPRHVALAKES